MTKSFLQAAWLRPDLSIVPGWPCRLGLIRHLLQLMHDINIGLIDTSQSGFHTGVFEPIQFSGIWRRQRSDARDDLHFKIYDTNWKSAEEDPDTVTRLLQEDLDMPSSSRSSTLTSLKLRSVGLKDLQLVASAFQGQKNRDPRLCLDSTIANVNAKAQIQEKSFNPCVEDSRRKPTPSKPHQGRMAMLPTWPWNQPLRRAHGRRRQGQDEQKCQEAAEAKTAHIKAIQGTLEKHVKTVTVRAESLTTTEADFFQTHSWSTRRRRSGISMNSLSNMATPGPNRKKRAAQKCQAHASA